jgi:N6-adenosine-specific RNA methylase IME4
MIEWRELAGKYKTIYIELFARERFSGWEVWDDEVPQEYDKESEYDLEEYAYDVSW